MAEGLNRYVLHTSVHQPSDKHVPGLGLGPYGQWFHRHDTWAAEAKPWIDYLGRSCFMLSQGRFVADIAYLYSEDSNPTARFGQERPGIPAGWQYDFVNGDIVANVLDIRNGALVSKAGVRYRILVIDNQIERMSDALEARIAEIRDAGIPVLDLRGTEELRNGGGKEHAAALKAMLDDSGIEADVAGLPDSTAFVHRRLSDGEIYWIANICSKPQAMTLGLRDYAPGKVPGGKHDGRKAFEPKVWRADRATVEDVPYRIENGRVFVDLELERDDAVFVVLHGKAAAKSLSISKKEYIPVQLGGEAFEHWTVHFAPKVDPVGEAFDMNFDGLEPWTASKEDRLRFFSGTATYRTAFDWPAGQDAGSVLLDLGRVCNMAHVHLNGRDLGLLWKEPFTLDVTDALVEGTNSLELMVTNSWGNRLIGDSRFHGDSRKTWTSWEFYTPDAPEPVSGLLGPVRLMKSPDPSR